MNKKNTLVGLGGITLVVALLSPAMAHTSPSDPDVSGNYYGSINPYIDSPTLFPTGPYASMTMLCDMEVLGDGASPSPLDEEDVDGTSGGAMPDGTFDDGGIGGACHTSDLYSYADYNTPGCDNSLGEAHAVDAVYGGSVWIGAACDWKSDGSARSLTTCVVGELRAGADVSQLADCVNEFNAGTTCGSDGTPDHVNFGYGGSGVPFTNNAAADGCDPVTDASASVYVFNHVEETSPLSATVATIGHIWQA